MLVNMKAILLQAEQGRYAIGCFNTPNLETIQAVVAAAEEEGMPVILSHAQSMDPPASLPEIAPAMLHFAQAASVPVCVHLDHGMDWDYVNRAMELGFTSVMFDLSEKSFDENADNLRQLCHIAHGRNITVEAELGILAAGIRPEPSSQQTLSDSLRSPASQQAAASSFPHTATQQAAASPFPYTDPQQAASPFPYTDPQQAAQFAAYTGVDALTVCFGTAHGQYKLPPRLDIGRVRQIRQILDGRCRIVMHGASGVDDAQICAAIDAGVSKINYYSGISRGCSQYIYGQLQQCGGNMHWHTVHQQALQFMKRHVREKIRLFAGRELSL